MNRQSLLMRIVRISTTVTRRQKSLAFYWLRSLGVREVDTIDLRDDGLPVTIVGGDMGTHPTGGMDDGLCILLGNINISFTMLLTKKTRSSMG